MLQHRSWSPRSRMETTDFLYVDLVKKQKHTPATDSTKYGWKYPPCVLKNIWWCDSNGLAAVSTSVPSTSESLQKRPPLTSFLGD